MSMPIGPQQQQQTPLVTTNQEVYSTHSSHGSIGPVIAVLAVITILGVVAGMIGRLCSGRRVLGHGQYDLEGWVETKCASCIDGRMDSPQPRRAPPHNSNGSGDSAPVTIQIETPRERKQTVQSAENPPAAADS